MTKIKIYIDCRSLTEKITGVGFYTLNLIKLLSSNEGFEVTLCSHKPLSKVAINILSNYDNIVVRKPKIRMNSFLWYNFIFPFQAWINNSNYIWASCNLIPILNFNRSILTVHDLLYLNIKGSIGFSFTSQLFLLQKYSIINSSFIVTPSNFTKQDIEARFKTDKSIDVFFPLINSEVNSILSNYDSINISFIKNSLLFVGDYQKRKNIKFLITLLPLLKKLKLKLIIAGVEYIPKNFTPDENLIINNNSDIVRFLGFISDSELNFLYSSSYSLIYPSLFEGFGIPSILAMKFSTPVIASSNSTLPEIVGAYGVMVKGYDLVAWERGLARLIKNYSSYRVKANKRYKMIKKYNWTNFNKFITKIKNN